MKKSIRSQCQTLGFYVMLLNNLLIYFFFLTDCQITTVPFSDQILPIVIYSHLAYGSLFFFFCLFDVFIKLLCHLMTFPPAKSIEAVINYTATTSFSCTVCMDVDLANTWSTVSMDVDLANVWSTVV